MTRHNTSETDISILRQRREYARQWRKNNPERWREIQARHNAKRDRRAYYTRADVRAKAAEKRRQRYATDPEFRIADIIGAAIRRNIKRGGGKKHRTAYYLGYPLPRLLAWIDKQGGIPHGYEIDHIVPFAEWRRRYPCDIVRQMRGAWNLANLRIISQSENRRKSAKLLTLV